MRLYAPWDEADQTDRWKRDSTAGFHPLQAGRPVGLLRTPVVLEKAWFFKTEVGGQI